MPNDTVSFELIGITSQTVDRLVKTNVDALTLYVAYANVASWQKTNQPKATNQFMMKRVRWGKSRFEKAKRVLVEMNLIENVRVCDPKTNTVIGWYTRIRHFYEDNTLKATTPQSEGGGSARRWESNPKVLEENNKVLEEKRKYSDVERQAFNRIHELAVELFQKTPQYKLSPNRKKLLQARLKDAGEPMMVNALKALAASPFHRGDNERGWKADPYWVFKNYEQTERFAEAYDESSKTTNIKSLTEIKI